MSERPFRPGLSGVTAGETGVASATDDSLCYRGYPIEQLAAQTCFEEVAHLLVYGKLPTRRELALFRDMLMEFRRVPSAVLDVLRTIPTDIPTSAVLRTTLSLAGHYDPVTGQSANDLRRRSVWLVALTASLIAARHRLRHHKELIAPRSGLSHAAQLFYQCHGREADPPAERLLDLALILCAEHDFNASSFTSRIIASTRSDLVSAVVGALAALAGPLHGGAAAEVVAVLTGLRSPEEAARYARRALENKEKIMGFGNRVHKKADPRARLLDAELRRFAESKGQPAQMAVYDALRAPLVEERGLYPNIDYPAALVFHLLDWPPDMFTPLFAAGRMAGWCAHYLEQIEQDAVFWPVSRYIGPPLRDVPSMAER